MHFFPATVPCVAPGPVVLLRPWTRSTDFPVGIPPGEGGCGTAAFPLAKPGQYRQHPRFRIQAWSLFLPDFRQYTACLFLAGELPLRGYRPGQQVARRAQVTLLVVCHAEMIAEHTDIRRFFDDG